MRKIIFGRNECENWSQESSLYFRRICYSYKRFCHDVTFKRFISFIIELFAAGGIQKDFFLIENDKNKTFIEFAMEEFKGKDLVFLCSLAKKKDLAEILQQTNSRGECAFHSASKVEDLESFRELRQLYEESFNKEIFRQIIVSSDRSWILDVVKCFMSFRKPSETFAELCQCLRDLFKDTDEAESLKPFFRFADKEGQTAFMVAAVGRNKEFKILFALTKELYDIETVKEFLLLKDKYGATSFTRSFIDGDDITFQIMKSISKEFFGREKMQELVMAKVENENILYWRCVFRPGSFEILCDFLVEVFEDEAQKLKYFFVSVDFEETVFMKAAEQSSINYFTVLVNLIELVFVKEEIVEMLCQRNLEGKTAFHFAIRNSEEEIFETVQSFYLKTLGNETMKNIILAEVDWTRVICGINSKQNQAKSLWRRRSDTETERIPDIHLMRSILRLEPVLASLFAEVDFINIFFKIFNEKTIKKSIRYESEESKESLISYFKRKFQDDQQVNKFILEIEKSKILVFLQECYFEIICLTFYLLWLFSL